MQADRFSPRTVLLAGLAGWCVVAWALALFGLGGRVSPLPEDASLLQALPQPVPAPDERLGPAQRYEAIASRPLFSHDRRPQPFSLGSDEEEDDGFDYQLTSVILAPGLEMAVLQPSEGEGDPVRVRLGEASEQAAAWRLVSLEPRRAVFEGPDGELGLDLRAFDGSGGEAATPSARPSGELAAATQAPGRPARAPDPDTVAEAADAAAQAAAQAGKAANTRAKPPSRPAAGADAKPVTTPDSQIEAIRKRIQERRAQLRRDAQQQSTDNNP